MGLLTAKAIEGYRNYTKRILAYGRYKIGSTYYKVPIDDVVVDSAGVIRISIMINLPTKGAATITEVQIFDYNNDMFLKKDVSLKAESVAEGFYYLFKLHIVEVFQNT